MGSAGRQGRTEGLAYTAGATIFTRERPDPDLREIQRGNFGDELSVVRVRNGVVRNGITYMPKMAEIMSQEALWVVRDPPRAA